MSISVTSHGPAHVVNLQWTEKRNALGPDDVVEVAEAIVEAGAAAAHAVVLTGDGAFCAGGDLRAFAEVSRTLPLEEIQHTVYGKVQSMMRALKECPVPTIAAVDGPAVGLGFDLALACDMRFVGAGGWFRQGWAKAGLIAGTGGIGLLHRLNSSALWPLVVGQEKIGAERAVELGLAEAAENGLAAALERAGSLTAFDRHVLGYYTELNRAETWPSAAHFERSAQIQAQLIGSAEFREMAARILGAQGAPA
jgi:enoyl-CoA hydratase/carnithine racemase